MKFLSHGDIVSIFETFKAQNPNPQTELIAKNDFTLLVSVVLSAQTTDKSVNKATKALYEIADTPEKMLALGEEKLISFIKSIGLYHSKAKHVMELSRILAKKYNSQIPSTREELMTLPGVGRKTANVILNVVYHQAVMPVDTHLLRLAPRIGFSEGKTPEKVEQDLVSLIPAEYMQHAHHWLILHGRYVCTARNPKCDECLISKYCKKNNVQTTD